MIMQYNALITILWRQQAIYMSGGSGHFFLAINKAERSRDYHWWMKVFRNYKVEVGVGRDALDDWMGGI